MITKEQSEKILSLSVKFTNKAILSFSFFENTGGMSEELEDDEEQAFQKLKSYVEGLTED